MCRGTAAAAAAVATKSTTIGVVQMTETGIAAAVEMGGMGVEAAAGGTVGATVLVKGIAATVTTMGGGAAVTMGMITATVASACGTCNGGVVKTILVDALSSYTSCMKVVSTW